MHTYHINLRVSFPISQDTGETLIPRSTLSRLEWIFLDDIQGREKVTAVLSLFHIFRVQDKNVDLDTLQTISDNETNQDGGGRREIDNRLEETSFSQQNQPVLVQFARG